MSVVISADYSIATAKYSDENFDIRRSDYNYGMAKDNLVGEVFAMALSETRRQNIALYVRSYIMRTALNFGHQNGAARATARWMHTLNVVLNLQQILDGEKASDESREICEVAAFFHDVDHYTVAAEYHAARGAETAARYLKKEGRSPEYVARVAEAVRKHSPDLDDDVPVARQMEEIAAQMSHEARMVMDADTLDKIGGSNILQAMLSMNKNQVSDVAKELTSGWPLQRAREWKDLLTTPTGKAIGAQRFDFYTQFLAQLKTEVVMVDPYPALTASQEVAQVTQV